MANVKINRNGDKVYYNDKDQYHRDDGPAILCKNGITFWYDNGAVYGKKFPYGLCIMYDQYVKRFLSPNGNVLWMYYNEQVAWPEL